MDDGAIRRIEGHVRAGRGRRLFRRVWLSGDPVRVIVLAHGFAEHSGRYEGIGSWLAARRAAVVAFDHQGHGRSSGRRNYVGRFDDFLDDLQQIVESARAEHPDLPCALIGHSMGGLIAAAFARERKPALTSLVLSGAALQPTIGGARLQVVALRLLSRIAPRFRMDAGLDVDALSRDPEVIRRYLEDPLVDTRITAALARAMMEAAARTLHGGAEVALPVLVLHGGDDGLCDPAGSEAFYARLPPSSGSDLRIYPGLRHEIFQEPEQEKIFEEVLAWLRQHETALA